MDRPASRMGSANRGSIRSNGIGCVPMKRQVCLSVGSLILPSCCCSFFCSPERARRPAFVAPLPVLPVHHRPSDAFFLVAQRHRHHQAFTSAAQSTYPMERVRRSPRVQIGAGVADLSPQHVAALDIPPRLTLPPVEFAVAPDPASVANSSPLRKPLASPPGVHCCATSPMPGTLAALAHRVTFMLPASCFWIAGNRRLQLLNCTHSTRSTWRAKSGRRPSPRRGQRAISFAETCNFVAGSCRTRPDARAKRSSDLR